MESFKAGLWKKVSKSGVVYFKGTKEGKSYTIYMNEKKFSDKSPDMNLIIEDVQTDFKKEHFTNNFKVEEIKEDHVPF